MSTTVSSWNITKGHEAWCQPLQLDVEIALLQKASSMSTDLGG